VTGDADHVRFEKRLGCFEQKLDKIMVEVTATGGRTSRLEQVVMGDPGRLMPNGSADRGLIGQVYDIGRITDRWKAMETALKWVAGTFGAATLSLLGNLAANLL
jgi:hypothetical protein